MLASRLRRFLILWHSNAIILEKKTGGASVAELESLAQAGGAVLGNERASIGA
jgi:hypothetical protein